VFYPTLMVLVTDRHSDSTRLLFWCAAGFCAGIYLFFHGFQLLGRRRLILDTPVSKIRSASMGMVEISGLAVGPYTMIAPITARPCYYFRTIVWEWKQRGRSKQWVKVAAECLHVPFFVDDNTGRMMVDPRGAELELHRDFQQEFCDSFFTTKDPAPDNVRTFLARHGVATNNKIKVEEFCIKPKNSLFILGTLAENPGIEVSPQPVRDEEASTVSSSVGGGRFTPAINRTGMFSGGDEQLSTSTVAQPPALAAAARPPRFIRLGGDSGAATSTDSRQQEKIAAALITAGISNPAAWSAAGLQGGAAGVQVIGDSMAELSGAHAAAPGSLEGCDPRPPVVLMKGIANKTFLISWRSQREVARALGWKCALMIWGGPLLSLFSLYISLSVENLL
jgi:E3 Ubiquitin ligase